MDNNSLTNLFDKPTGRQWSKIGINKRAGILTALSAVKSKKGLGVGEIMDMKLLVDWCVNTGNSIIQILPLNEMREIDNNPFSVISVFSIDPVYLSLYEVKGFASSDKVKRYLQQNKDRIEHLKSLKRVDFNAAREVKVDILKIIFAEGYQENEYSAFSEDNKHWLDNYSLFSRLKRDNKGVAWFEWEDKYRDRDEKTLEEYSREHADELNFYKYVQWLLYNQLSSVKNYAQERKVYIMGDLPFLVGMDSVDVWADERYFKRDLCGGAPPDMYSEEGQNWHNPIYNWENIEADGYRWWKNRLKYAENFYDLVRLDHVLGFFRIFAIPAGDPHALNGFYEPADENLWRGHGEKILRMIIESTNIFIVGEDLGTVPDCCREVMAELGIPGYKIERWEKNYHHGGNFIDPADYNPVSLASLGTHDSETLRGWWQAFSQERCSYLQSLGYDGEPPQKLDHEIEDKIYKRFYKSSSIFLVLGLWDILSFIPGLLNEDPEENRINIPGTEGPWNWTLRLDFYLEEMVTDRFKAFNEKIKDFLVESNRLVL